MVSPARFWARAAHPTAPGLTRTPSRLDHASASCQREVRWRREVRAATRARQTVWFVREGASRAAESRRETTLASRMARTAARSRPIPGAACATYGPNSRVEPRRLDRSRRRERGRRVTRKVPTSFRCCRIQPCASLLRGRAPQPRSPLPRRACRSAGSTGCSVRRRPLRGSAGGPQRRDIARLWSERPIREFGTPKRRGRRTGGVASAVRGLPAATRS